MTQEFHISVTPVGQNDYLVRTEQVAPGVPLAEELVSWPVADWLAAAGQLMIDPLKSVLQGDAIARNSVNLVALGQQLYSALFQGTLRDSWITAQGIAQNHQQVLRLRLGLKDTRLARLPWEVMHAGDRPIATGPYIAFCRYQSGIAVASRRLPTTNMPILAEEGKIKVLMAIASPSDQVPLDLLKHEAVRLKEELLRTTEGLPEIELTVLEQPGREELTQALEQGRYHVLHYSGHSNLGRNGGEIYLVSSRTGLTETLTGEDLAGLLVNNNIQMAVFNSCLGAFAATSNPTNESGEWNLTESLVKRGIKCVLAMSERIPEDVALTLTQLFYRNLSQGYPVDICVSRVRQGLISAYGSHLMYWALPILYLQPEFDGRLSPGLSPQSPELLDDYHLPPTTDTDLYTGVDQDPDIDLPLEEMMASGLPDSSSGLDLWGEDAWDDLGEGLGYDNGGYEEDSAIVSELFSQLERPNPVDLEPTEANELAWQNSQNSIVSKPVSQEVTASPNPVTTYNTNPSVGVQSQTAGETSNDSPYPASNSPQPAPTQPRSQRKQSLIIGGVVLSSAIVAIVGLTQWRQQPPIKTESPQVVTAPNETLVSIRTDSTGIVTAEAVNKLGKGDLDLGLPAVEELLNRNALTEAKNALEVIPLPQSDDPKVLFFRGRLAWEFVKAGNKDYSLDDARRYWESATKMQPDSFTYKNALGFAYYAEKNINRANNAWFRGLDLAIQQQAHSRDRLTAYAGLALGLHQSAANQQGDKRKQYLSEAIKLRKKILSEDPVNFQPDNLSKNWLWTKEAIQDWNALLQLPSEN